MYVHSSTYTTLYDSTVLVTDCFIGSKGAKSFITKNHDILASTNYNYSKMSNFVQFKIIYYPRMLNGVYLYAIHINVWEICL